jgi:DNA-binding transcriptional LysR family regulator
MKMQQVRYFLAICEEHNFTRAARRCGVTQPSLTRAVQLLECELGGVLFQRSQRGIELSPLGRAVWPHLLQIERAESAARQAAENVLAMWPASHAGSPTHGDLLAPSSARKRSGRYRATSFNGMKEHEHEHA